MRIRMALTALLLASSAGAALAAEDDELVEVAPLLDRYGDFAAFLGDGEDQQASRAQRASEINGRPVGSAAWIAELEASSGRSLAPKKRGPKPKGSSNEGFLKLSR